MAITALDTHQTVKDLTAAGFTDSQAEALTHALQRAQQIDLSDLASKTDLAAVKADLAAVRHAAGGAREALRRARPHLGELRIQRSSHRDRL